jgi:hypothetical protein
MPAPGNLVGQTFARLHVLKRAPSKKNSRKTFYLCRCTCGNEVVVRGDKLTESSTLSCGCYAAEMGAARARLLEDARIIHGDDTTSPTWSSWRGAVLRATVPLTDRPQAEIDPHWHVYAHFVADMGEKTPGQQLGRVDPSAPYTKSNCRWEEA